MNMFYEALIWEITKAEANEQRLRRMSKADLDKAASRINRKLDDREWAKRDHDRRKEIADDEKRYASNGKGGPASNPKIAAKYRAYDRLGKEHDTMSKGNASASRLLSKSRDAINRELERRDKLDRRNNARLYAKKEKESDNELYKKEKAKLAGYRV